MTTVSLNQCYCKFWVATRVIKFGADGPSTSDLMKMLSEENINYVAQGIKFVNSIGECSSNVLLKTCLRIFMYCKLF